MQILTEIDGSGNSKALIVVEIIEYISDSAVSGTSLRNTKRNMPGSSLNQGVELAEAISPCNIYIQRTDEVAELIIGNKKYLLQPGEGIFVPAHKKHCFFANDLF